MSNREDYSSWNEDQYEYEQRQSNTIMITDKEIKECGWAPETILIEKSYLNHPEEHIFSQGQDDDIYIEGWSFTKNDKMWWEMCRNGNRLLIVKKWYWNEVSQEWDVVMDVPISDKQELLGEMSYLGIK